MQAVWGGLAQEFSLPTRRAGANLPVAGVQKQDSGRRSRIERP